jgi:acyl-CoA thioesterase I
LKQRSEGLAMVRRQLWPKAARVALAATLLVTLGGQLAISAGKVKLVALGDSITAGLGVKVEEAYPARLQELLAAKGVAVEIANAGVSGDTSADGLDRLDWSVPEGTDGVILALGANDLLRGLDPARMGATLDKIISGLEARKISVLLVGMKASSNYGDGYRAAYDKAFPDLAAKHGIGLYPFLLQDVALDPALNQGDGIHPNPKGAARIAERMLPDVQKLIERIGKR